MGGCCGCFRKTDDLNEINQDDILWLKTPSSLTNGIPSNNHFSIGGLSNMSSQEPAVVTIARKAQEKADQEKGRKHLLDLQCAQLGVQLIEISSVNKLSLFRLYAHLFFQIYSQVGSPKGQTDNECGWRKS